MKRQIINSLAGFLLFLIPGLISTNAHGQEKEKSELRIGVSYFTVNNNLQYLKVNAKAKIDGRFMPKGGIAINLYLDKDSSGKGVGLIGTVVTDEKGNASSLIPPSVEKIWNATTNHTFLAVADKSKDYDESEADITVAKSKITVDTVAGKIVVATVSEFKDNKWVPVKGVDVKLCIKRMGGDLMINDDDSYTTDSLGTVQGQLKKMGMPGDEKGSIVLVAKVVDNDQYGNLRAEKAEPWGKVFIANDDFFTRALWGSQFHSPFWLIIIAYSIIISVWGTLVYLVFLIVKIKKLGREEEKLS